MNKIISIIIPVYNVELYLPRCIESVIQQTYRNIEIILVNDGSIDSCPKICDDYGVIDKRIKVIHKLNGGLSSARNAGIEIASGEYIGFVDSDDFIENDMYEKLLKACIENKAEISMCGRYNYSEDGTIIPVFTLPSLKVWSGKQAVSNLLIWNKIDSSACDKLFLKDLFIDIRFPNGKVCEDIFVIPEIIYKSAFLVHIGEAKYYYYKRKGSISRSGFSLNRMNMLDAHEYVANFVKNKYVDLQEKADSFYFYAFLSLYKEFFSTNAFRTHFYLKQIVDDLAHLNFFSILRNRYVPIRGKIVFLLIYLKIYVPIKKLEYYFLNQIQLLSKTRLKST